MIKIPVKEGESIERALKRLKRKTDSTGIIKEVRKRKELLYIKTLETIERLWKIEGKITRPKNTEIGHTGFLTFVRKIL